MKLLYQDREITNRTNKSQFWNKFVNEQETLSNDIN